MNLTRKTISAGMGLLTLCGVAILALPRTTLAEGPTLQDITAAVTKAESAVQDLRIEFTCVGKPLGQDSESLMSMYPGNCKPSTCVYVKKGDKERLDKLSYEPTSETEQRNATISFGGTRTHALRQIGADQHIGQVMEGRWHAMRSVDYLNPTLTRSAQGDLPLSKELSTMGAELEKDPCTVDGVSCQAIRLYKRLPSGTVLRSFKVYLDPARDYAVIRVEKYWYEFQCLERTVDVEELATVKGVYVATKAKCTTYRRPDNSTTSQPLYEKVLTATNVQVNSGISDSAFALDFPVGTRVWDSTLQIVYQVPEPESPGQ